MLPLLVLLGTIAGAWYLLIVRPQKDQQTRHGRLVERLQVGDHVLTVGGIYGRVVAVEGASVVLELAPGLTSRIATDGIARIVHGGEAALPTSTQHIAQDAHAGNPHETREPDMQEHPHQGHPHEQQPAPQFAAPAWTAPPQPYAPQPAMHQHAPAPQPMPMAPQSVAHHQAPQPAPVPHAQVAPQHAQVPQHQLAPLPVATPQPTTLRAHVVGATIPTFEPRPWGDVAPVNAPGPQPAAQQPVVQPQYAAMPAQPQYAPQAPTPAPAPAPVAMPMHQPFAQPQPAMQAPQPVAMPQQAYAPQLAAPVQQPIAAPVAPQVAPPSPVEQPARRHSNAPSGMGSSLRLDDPSLRDTMARARDERAGLADEYRKLTAPLVDVGSVADQPVPVQVEIPPGATFVGHDPNGVPLFATPDAPLAHPVAQYPAPARLEAASAMPRPVVQPPHGAVDPALSSSAFQRRAPYAPATTPGSTPIEETVPQPATAHAGMA